MEFMTYDLAFSDCTVTYVDCLLTGVLGCSDVVMVAYSSFSRLKTVPDSIVIDPAGTSSVGSHMLCYTYIHDPILAMPKTEWFTGHRHLQGQSRIRTEVQRVIF